MGALMVDLPTPKVCALSRSLEFPFPSQPLRTFHAHVLCCVCVSVVVFSFSHLCLHSLVSIIILSSLLFPYLFFSYIFSYFPPILTLCDPDAFGKLSFQFLILPVHEAEKTCPR